MTRLHQSVDDYLTIRQSLGFKFERHGRLLPQLADYLQTLDRHGHRRARAGVGDTAAGRTRQPVG